MGRGGVGGGGMGKVGSMRGCMGAGDLARAWGGGALGVR
jgi:hypothetical protein